MPAGQTTALQSRMDDEEFMLIVLGWDWIGLAESRMGWWLFVAFFLEEMCGM